jgi:predicted P-loop ATPase
LIAGFGTASKNLRGGAEMTVVAMPAIAHLKEPHHKEWTKDSGVSETIAGLNPKSIESSVEIAKLLNWEKYHGSPGWYFRSCDPMTGRLTNKGQFKPDIPIQFPDSDKPQKYFSFPKGSESEIICLVLALDDWIKISERVGVPIADEDIDRSREDLGFWRWVLNHPQIPILITEGGKKAACLLSHGWVAIALTGVWNGQQNKKLHPSLVPFIVPGRKVYLVFDADIVVKKSVQDALKILGNLIHRAKAIVRVVIWDLELGKGCDDFIVAHGPDEFQTIMDNSKLYDQWIEQLEKQFKPKTQNGGGDDRDILKEIESRFSGRFRLNRLTGEVELDGQPIRVDEFYITLRRRLGLKVNKQLAVDLVMQLARENEYSPVVEYLERVSQQFGDTTMSLLNDVAGRYFGTSEPLYDTYIKRTLIGAVARALNPGCKLDTALILQGKQGYFKSTFFNTLAGKWFDDSLGDATSNKDERLKLRASWFLEWAELERAFSKRSTSDIKAFMTCRVDNLRVPYGRVVESFPRHCVLVGTSNEEEFLADPTGDRRFWVVPVQQRIECKLLEQERDRIWAAAVALYRKGEEWWLTPQEETLSMELNKPFHTEDPWTTHIRDYVDSLHGVGGAIKVYTKDILENCLQMDKGRQEKSSQIRVTNILKRLGFTKKKDSQGYSCWSRLLTPLTPTDIPDPKVSVSSSNDTTTVSGEVLTLTDTFSENYNKNSEVKVIEVEKINTANLGEKISIVSVASKPVASMVSATDTDRYPN